MDKPGLALLRDCLQMVTLGSEPPRPLPQGSDTDDDVCGTALRLPADKWNSLLATMIRRGSSSRSQAADRRETLFRAVKEQPLREFRMLLTSLSTSVRLESDAMRAPGSHQNLVHFALENKCHDHAVFLIETVSVEALMQSHDVTVCGMEGRKNVLHRIVELGSVRLGTALLQRLTSPRFLQLVNEETPIADRCQRRRTLPCLHLAAYKSMKPMVDLLLQSGAEANHRNSMGDTALLWAARFNQGGVAQALLAAGADPNLENARGSTPLYWAVRYGHLDMVRLLLDSSHGRADVSKSCCLGKDAPIVLASSTGNVDILKLLLDRGADANSAVRGLERPLHQAARQGHVTVVRTLLAAGAELDAGDYHGDTALTLAAQHGRLDVLELLIRAGADVNRRNHGGEDVWYHAVHADEDEMLRLLLLTLVERQLIRDRDESSSGPLRLTCGAMTSPLLQAAAAGLADRVAVLLDMGLDALDSDLEGNSLLHLAAQNNQVAVIVQFANKVGVDVRNKAGETPLHVACRHGHHDAIKALLRAKAKVSIRNGQGQTPLHVLAGSPEAREGSVRAVVSQAKRAQDWEGLQTTDEDGRNALHVAALYAAPEVLRQFKCVRLQERDNNGNLPLHLAVRKDQPEIMDAMLDLFENRKRDANINEQNERKESVLHLAASAGFARAVARLVRLGADLSLPDQAGDSVLHRLTRALATDPSNERKYMKVVETVLGEAAWWWCARHELPYPGRENAQLQQLYRRRALVLLVRQTFNQADLSPLTLACHLGAAPLLRHLMMMDDVMRVKINETVRYDVTDLTPRTNHDLPQGSSKFSGLEFISSVKENEAVANIMDIPPVRILEKFYSKVALCMTLILFLLHIVYMTAFSTLATTLLNRLLHTPADQSLDVTLLLVYIIVPTEPLLIVFHAFYVGARHPCMGELARQVSKHPGCCSCDHLRTLMSFVRTVVIHLYSLIYAVSVIVWIVLYSLRYPYQDYVLATALCWGWLLTITFTRGFRPIHFFWKMLQSIILTDVLKFIFVYVFVLLAFTMAIHSIFQVSTSLMETYPTPVHTAFKVFKLMLGVVDLADGDFRTEMMTHGRSDAFAKVVYICYTVMANVVLLNLLIAMMNDSYAAILAKQRLRWRAEAMQLGLDIERSLPMTFRLLTHCAVTCTTMTKMSQRLQRGRLAPGLEGDEDCWYIQISLEEEQEALSRRRAGEEEVVVELEDRIQALEDRLTKKVSRLLEKRQDRNGEDGSGKDRSFMERGDSSSPADATLP